MTTYFGKRLISRSGAAFAAAVALFSVSAGPAHAHPHVWVDGGVDFVLGEGATLESIEVTWLYDEFETLYTLSAAGLAIDETGSLTEEDRLALVALLSDWPDDFDGSAHLSHGDHPVSLGWPADLDVQMIDGRLQITFARDLVAPFDLMARPLDVGFYESTYFFAFSITNAPRLIGDAGNCAAHVIPFEMEESGLLDLQATLYDLGREETPMIDNVGALFADRIRVQCA